MPFTETSRVTLPFASGQYVLKIIKERREGGTIETVMTLGFGMETDPFMFVPSLAGTSEIMMFCNSKPLRPSSPFSRSQHHLQQRGGREGKGYRS